MRSDYLQCCTVLGADFCKNIALGYTTTLSNLFSEAQSGHPDPNWDFEPDTVHIKKGTNLSVVDQGREPNFPVTHCGIDPGLTTA